MQLLRHNAPPGIRAALRRAALRAAFGITLFAASGATPSHANAAVAPGAPAPAHSALVAR